MHATESMLGGLRLHTVCHQARCPNISECFARGTATFMILGDACTRSCRFCGVTGGKPAAEDPGEPERVAEAVGRMGIRHAVITSVTRDDLDDGGAALFASTVRAVRNAVPGASIEVLVPDFRGDESSVRTVVDAGPDIFGHNIETVPRLYESMNRREYARSIGVLATARKLSPLLRTKSAIMLGLGETGDQVIGALRDLRGAGCDYLSIGQYLQPDRSCVPVTEYVSPERFLEYGDLAREMGFSHVESGVYVRSSYMAEKYNE
ncbi:MAG: lipoyl synthase [Spirochaetes bacterium]|nr:lipoyl synthase [Spirochaetota bacterium]